MYADVYVCREGGVCGGWGGFCTLSLVYPCLILLYAGLWTICTRLLQHWINPIVQTFQEGLHKGVILKFRLMLYMIPVSF